MHLVIIEYACAYCPGVWLKQIMWNFRQTCPKNGKAGVVNAEGTRIMSNGKSSAEASCTFWGIFSSMIHSCLIMSMPRNFDTTRWLFLLCFNLRAKSCIPSPFADVIRSASSTKFFADIVPRRYIFKSFMRRAIAAFSGDLCCRRSLPIARASLRSPPNSNG